MNRPPTIAEIPQMAIKVSVVTAVYNRVDSIGDTIESVLQQRNVDVEYILVDGASTDGTSKVIDLYSNSIDHNICEPDNGIYDALNKGIEASTGDIIGFLHADDVFYNTNVLSNLVAAFNETETDSPDGIKAVYGDLLYVKSQCPTKVHRYWRSGPYRREKFRQGWMPPHPTVYVRREIYQRYGCYRTDLGSAADYECMVRLFFRHSLRLKYVPQTIVRMKTGGESNVSIGNRLKANAADREAWKLNELAVPFGLMFTKPLRKLPQYFSRPKI